MGAEMKTIGYIILIEAKATQDKTSEAMSYGYPNETDSEMLLRRGRATLFESYEETEQALKETLLAATAQNSKWPEKFIYKIVPVEVTAPYPKPEQEPDYLTIAYMSGFHDGKNKYAPQRKWVGLTEEEIDRLNFLLVEGCQCSFGYVDNVEEFAQSIEAKLREKNGC
jgi:hypothetical protein